MTTPVYGATHAQAPARAHGGRGHATASNIGIAGSLLALIGSFLPWIEVTAGGQSVDKLKGMDGDGVITLVAAIAAIVLFGVGVAMRKAVISACGAVPALVIVVMGIMNMTDTERLPTQKLEDEGIPSESIKEGLTGLDMSTMFGLYVLLIGAVIAVVAGALAFVKGRSR
ncbi:MAG: hypothetical protein HOV68_18355 [Streptomycetaceae bacterium]|nr:hypothetical protein [Streptomycetaceae bacterium]